MRRKPKLDWKGQVGMDVGEQRQRAELESSVQMRIVDTLEAIGVVVERQNVGAFKIGKRFVRFGKRGDPDLRCLMYPGICFWIETKRGKGGVITDEQRTRVADLRRMGFVAGFASSPDEAMRIAHEARTEAKRTRERL